ncbi:DUF4144 family protein [Psychromonas sp. Urea-02u-13]|uniref:DUF4144 family protein n=1 Tax=Psychromonas sp. Urea-02u-13 TaxID=2058326 RepID=UPI000C324352|nr:DUF4144 family protein [Psychromonas sp. Urea-02u-13]PKG37858.1 hypothetical protein CXF74_16685 [Psychromonas sp. Urea-02u-13]
MIVWPCILKLDGDDELIYLGSECAFKYECDALILSDDDYILDSTGCTYLVEERSGVLTLIKTGRVLELEDVTQLIRANEFQKAELCLTKIYFASISDAIKSTNELALLNQL